MPFDDGKFNRPAKQGDVAGVALYAALGFAHVASALERVSEGGDIDEAIKGVREISDKLDAIFNDLSGWTAE